MVILEIAIVIGLVLITVLGATIAVLIHFEPYKSRWQHIVDAIRD